MRLFYLYFLFVAEALYATPTSLFWTNCTTDVQAPNTLHLNINQNVKLQRKSGTPLDIGLLGGLYGDDYMSIEAGADYQYHINHPISGNAKIKFFPNSAYSLSLGVYNVGTQPVMQAVSGTSFEEWGKVYIGGYASKRHVAGYMVGYQKFWQDKKWLFSADYASGKNSVSGFGIALSYYFTPQVNLQTGPVCFRNRHLKRVWQWSFQLGVDL